MSTHLTPEGFRTAAYLEARARLDARKTRGVVKCTPPNTKCGNRCIPPEWDCRIKGEGSDPLLAAKRTDPISGIANFERGFNRLGRFARTGSFSELESSKNSFVRGAVKLKPGNLKEKKEFEQWLKENYAKIAVPLFVAGGLLGGHVILKKGDVFGYRRGVGQKIDNAVSTGISAVLDIVPFVGQARSYTRRQAAAAAEAVQQRSRGLVNLRETMNSAPAELIPGTPISSTLIKGNSALTRALNNVNTSSSTTSFYDWNLKHQQAFWGASHSRKPMAEDERFLAGRSIYAEPAAQAYINDAWQLNLPADATRVAYINTLAQKYTIEAEAYLQLAKQQGFRVYGRPGAEYVHRDDRPDFIERNVRNISDPQIRAAQSEFIAASISGLSPAGRARRRYQVITATFDNYYKGVAKSLTEVAGVPAYDPDVTSLSPVRAAAERRRIDYMMQTAPARITRKTSAGPAHDRLFLKDYYHTKVAGNERSTYTLSNSEAIRAATELSGNEIRTSAEAIELLQQNGYRNARLEVRRNPFQTRRSSTSRQAPPPEGGRPARRRRIPDAQVIKDYMAAGFTQAEAEAFLARLKEQRGDSPEDGITAYELAYLIAQSRQDKRCGKSGIPETRKCSKTTPAQSEEARFRARGAADPGVTCRPGMQQCGKICIPESTTCHLRGAAQGSQLMSKIAQGALAAGAVAAGAGVYKYRKPLSTAVKVTRNTIKAERKVYNNIKNAKLAKRNSYGRPQYSPESAARAARREYVATRQAQVRAVTPYISRKIVDELSKEQVTQGIGKLPKQFQEPARNLIGHAKRITAGIGLQAEGFEVVRVNNQHNFSTFRKRDGQIASIGSVGDSIVIYNSELKGNIRGVDYYGMAFTVDRRFDQKQSLTKDDKKKIADATKEMFRDNIDSMPNNAFVFNVPYSEDGKGRGREAAYKRQGFRRITRSDRMWAIKDQGEFRKLTDQELEALMQILNERGDAADSPKQYPVRVSAYLTQKEKLNNEPA